MQHNVRFALLILGCAGLVALVWLMLHGKPETPEGTEGRPPFQSRTIAHQESLPPAPSSDVPAPSQPDGVVRGGRTSVLRSDTGTGALHPGAIVGRVRQTDGELAADAVIAILQAEGENALVPPERPVSRETRTAHNGEFVIANLPVGRYSLWARTDAYAQVETAHLSFEYPTADLDIMLAAAGHISGVVRHISQEPAAGVQLWAMQPAGPSRGGLSSRRVSITDDFSARLLPLPEPVLSSEDGEFHFAGLPRQPMYILAMSPDTAPALKGPVRPSYDGLDIEFAPGGSVSGHVVLDGTDAPVPAVQVVLRGATAPERQEALTAEDGRFDFFAVRSGTCALALNDDDYALAQGILPRVRVRDGEVEAGIVLRVVPASAVAGHVYDRDTGNPMAGVYVSARGEGLVSTATARTDRQGAYTIGGMGPGEYRLSAASPSLRFAPSADVGREASVSLRAGQTLDGVDFRLSFGAGIQGHVVDEQGRPVPFADVFISEPQGAQLRVEKADDQGHYAAAGLTPGATLRLQARRMALVSREPVSAQVPSYGLLDDVTLVLAPGARIMGRVVRSSGGAPVENAPVYLMSPQPSSLRLNMLQITGEDGAFMWDGLPGGDFVVALMPRGGRAQGTPPSVDVRLADGVDSPPLTLTWDGPVGDDAAPDHESGTRVIRGRVTARQGDPISGVTVHARAPSGYAHRAETLHDGTFEISGIPAGSYSLRAFHRNYAPGEPLEVQAGDFNVRIVLQPAARASGDVIDAATGQPIAEFEVAQTSVRYLDRESSLASVGWERMYDPEGKFTITLGLGRESRVIVARASGYAPEQIHVGDVAPGQEVANLVFRLRAGAVVQGLVRDGAGNPVPGATIYQGTQERRSPAVARTDAQGVFRAEGLEAGAVVLTASHSAYAPETRTVNTRLGATTNAEFVLSGGGSVEGFVMRSREPVRNQMVSLSILDRSENVLTDAEGYYHFDRLPAGEGTVFVNLRGHAGEGSQFMRAQRPVIVANNHVTRADFEFSNDNAVIEGVVRVEGNPVSTAHIGLTIDSPSGEQRTGGRVDANGYYRFENLSAGSAIIEVMLHGGSQRRSKTVALEILPGQRIQQDIDFGPVALITGTVRGVRRGEQAHVSVLPGVVELERPTLDDVQHLAALMTGYAPVSPDGAFEVGNLEPGVYTVIAVAIRGEPQTELEAFMNARYVSQSIEIEPGKPLDILLNLR